MAGGLRWGSPVAIGFSPPVKISALLPGKRSLLEQFARWLL
ncbi:MAG TPA: hypothetical protein VF579_05385 [Candidatus Methylomirabilis sp.]